MCIRKQNFNHAAEVIKVGLLYHVLHGIVIAFMNSLFNNACKSYMRQLISTLRLVFILKGYKIEKIMLKSFINIFCTLYLVHEKYFLLTHNFIFMYALI